MLTFLLSLKWEIEIFFIKLYPIIRAYAISAAPMIIRMYPIAKLKSDFLFV